MSDNYAKLQEKKIKAIGAAFAEFLGENIRGKENVSPARGKIENSKKRKNANGNSPFRAYGVNPGFVRTYNTRKRTTKPTAPDSDDARLTEVRRELPQKKNNSSQIKGKLTQKTSEPKSGSRRYDPDPEYRAGTLKMETRREYNTRSRATLKEEEEAL